MTMDMASVEDARLTGYRRRLLSALASAIAEKGLAATTINDVVERAGVSKRDFYLAYPSKEDAFLDLYRAASRRGIEAVTRAMQGDRSPEDVLRQAVHGFLALLDREPALTRAHFLDIYGLGRRGLAARREAVLGYCEAIWVELERARGRRRPRRMPVQAMTAALGAVNELALASIESGSSRALVDLAEVAARVVEPLVGAGTAARVGAVRPGRAS